MTDFNTTNSSDSEKIKEVKDQEEDSLLDDLLKTNENEQYNIDIRLPFGKLDLIRVLYC